MASSALNLIIPSEALGPIAATQETVLDLEEVDFFDLPENRLAILGRENQKCFYCMSALNSSNYVIEHVVSRPEGNNSYRNVVAACLSCNNRKGNSLADDFLRGLYRAGYLSSPEFELRLSALELLREGGLKPTLNHHP